MSKSSLEPDVYCFRPILARARFSGSICRQWAGLWLGNVATLRTPVSHGHSHSHNHCSRKSLSRHDRFPGTVEVVVVWTWPDRVLSAQYRDEHDRVAGRQRSRHTDRYCTSIHPAAVLRWPRAIMLMVRRRQKYLRRIQTRSACKEGATGHPASAALSVQSARDRV